MSLSMSKPRRIQYAGAIDSSVMSSWVLCQHDRLACTCAILNLFPSLGRCNKLRRNCQNLRRSWAGHIHRFSSDTFLVPVNPTVGCLLARYAPRPALKVGQATWSASLEALLVGHEDWVHSLAWQPGAGSSPHQSALPHANHLKGGEDSAAVTSAAEGAQQRLTLLSASMDRTMMLWRPDTGTGT